MDDQKRIKFTTKVLPDGDESARIGFNFGDVLFCEISGDGDKVSRLFTDILDDLVQMVKQSNYPRSLEGLNKLSSEDLNRLAASILFSHLTRDGEAESITRDLANVSGFDYSLHVAEALVEQIPEAKKAIADQFLNKAKEGKAPARFPAVYWPKDKAQKGAKLAKEAASS